MKNNDKNINNKNINNMTNEETHEQQVMRVVREMVASGELVTSVDASGETLYSLPEKAKPADEIFRKRSEAAHKAWNTRRKLQTSKEAAHMDRVKFKVKKDADALFRKRSEAAHKAWATRRLLEAEHTHAAKPKMKKACKVKHKPCKAAKTAELPTYSVVFTSFVEYIQVLSHDKRALHSR